MKEIVCNKCGKKTVNGGKGMCRNCYHKQWRDNLEIKKCPHCEKHIKIYCKGLCQMCYRQTIGKTINCIRCRKSTKDYGYSMCKSCSTVRSRKLKYDDPDFIKKRRENNRNYWENHKEEFRFRNKHMSHARYKFRNIKRACVVCDNIKSEIHHMDGNYANNVESNIMWLCKEHHSLEQRNCETWGVSEVKKWIRENQKVKTS